MDKIGKKSLGFTLIELLFVIAIIGVLASMGVSLMQKKTEEFKVKKAALQIQYILEAGLSFYTDNQRWPSNAYTIPPDDSNLPNIDDCSNPSPHHKALINFCQYYLGTAIQKDPWGISPYSWWTKGIKGTADYSTGRFSVIVKTPDVSTAQRVGALLPYAEYCRPLIGDNWDCSPDSNDPSRTWVRAYVNIPGQAQDDQPVKVVAAGVVANTPSKKVCVLKTGSCNPNKPTDKGECIYTCKVNTTINCTSGTPHVYSSLSGYYIDQAARPAVKIYTEATLNSNNQPVIHIHFGGHPGLKPNQGRNYKVYDDTLSAFYLATCEKNYSVHDKKHQIFS
jgi:prepilin-type N-terminal cleavage/methylation domain-containing protein